MYDVTIPLSEYTEWELCVDLPNKSKTGISKIPTNILVTNQIPDLVPANRRSRQIMVCELTVCFENVIVQVASRNESHYSTYPFDTSYKALLFTIDIGSRGLINSDDKHTHVLKPNLNTSGTI